MNVRCATKITSLLYDRRIHGRLMTTGHWSLAATRAGVFSVTPRQSNETAMPVRYSWVIRLHTTMCVILCYSFTKISCSRVRHVC